MKWRVAVLGKLLNSAAARLEFSMHGGLSFDDVVAELGERGMEPRGSDTPNRVDAMSL